jgi:hypothetical protein
LQLPAYPDVAIPKRGYDMSVNGYFRASVLERVQASSSGPEDLYNPYAENSRAAGGRKRIAVMHVIDTLAAAGAERVAVNIVNHLPREKYAPYLNSCPDAKNLE